MKRAGGRPPLRAFRRPEHADRLGLTNFERTHQLEAIVRVKQLQSAGDKHDVALAIVAGESGHDVRQLQRWHHRFKEVADSEARKDRHIRDAVAASARFMSAWTMLTIDLQRIAEKRRVANGVIVAAVEAAQADAGLAGVQWSQWIRRESTRQKLAELLTTA